MRYLLIVLMLCLCSSGFAQYRMLNPVSDVNYFCMSPIMAGGIPVNPSSKNPGADALDKARTKSISPICVCPGVPPRPGISFGMNSPTHILESTTKEFRFPSLGIKESNKLAAPLAGADAGDDFSKDAFTYTHIIGFSVLKLLDIFQDTVCVRSTSVLDLLYISEIDPMAASSSMAILVFPEAVLMSNPVVVVSCAADALSALVGVNIDPMYWCAGGHTIYPMSNFTPQANSFEDSSSINMAKSMYRMNRITGGQAFGITAGKPAECSVLPSPLVIKSQYRLQPAMPMVGGCERIGTPSIKWNTPKRSTIKGDKVDILWTREDCCAL